MAISALRWNNDGLTATLAFRDAAALPAQGCYWFKVAREPGAELRFHLAEKSAKANRHTTMATPIK
jgi:hypothetical protein